MTTIITTESGTRYEYKGRKMRRIPEGNALPMRRDGEDLSFTFWGTPTVGRRMRLILEPLGDGNSTIRTTTPVVSIEEVE